MKYLSGVFIFLIIFSLFFGHILFAEAYERSEVIEGFRDGRAELEKAIGNRVDVLHNKESEFIDTFFEIDAKASDSDGFTLDDIKYAIIRIFGLFKSNKDDKKN